MSPATVPGFMFWRLHWKDVNSHTACFTASMNVFCFLKLVAQPHYFKWDASEHKEPFKEPPPLPAVKIFGKRCTSAKRGASLLRSTVCHFVCEVSLTHVHDCDPRETCCFRRLTLRSSFAIGKREAGPKYYRIAVASLALLCGARCLLKKYL